jgi:hypothetical protein
MRIEFAVDEAWPQPGHTMIAGRVHEADIALGDVFTVLVRAVRLREAANGTDISESTATHLVTLRVAGIEAYRHSLELLSSGMTGHLKLTGMGQDLLQLVDLSEGYGSWLLIGDKHAQPNVPPDCGGTT